MTPLKQLLGRIARKHLFILTLESQNLDSLDFHTVSIWAVEGVLKAAYQAGRKSTKSDDIDIDAVLAKRMQIAILWDAEDVKEMRPDLTDEQVWEVLKQTRHQHDATLGICWETLEFTAQTLFGDAPELDEA